MVVNTRTKAAADSAAGAQQSNEDHRPVRERLQEVTGAPQSTVERKPLKSNLLSFDNGHVRSQLNIVRKWDDIIEDYGQEEPQFYCMVGGKYADLPKESQALIEFGRYLRAVGEAIEGVKFAQSNFSAEDVLTAKERLAKIRGE